MESGVSKILSLTIIFRKQEVFDIHSGYEANEEFANQKQKSITELLC